MPTMIDKSEYYVGAASYLARAKARLEDGTKPSLFYAAYEIRCAVEALQNMYLDAQRKYAESVPKAWRIKEQGAELERIFTSDTIQKITWRINGSPDFTAYHVPVDTALREGVQGLNDLLHAQTQYRKFYNRWWVQSRKRVIGVYRAAWMCTRGNMLSPVLQSLEDGKRLMGEARLSLDGDDAKAFAAFSTVGVEMMIHVEYLKESPAQWTPDVDVE
jgi:hypothetical protein